MWMVHFYLNIQTKITYEFNIKRVKISNNQFLNWNIDIKIETLIWSWHYERIISIAILLFYFPCSKNYITGFDSKAKMPKLQA